MKKRDLAVRAAMFFLAAIAVALYLFRREPQPSLHVDFASTQKDALKVLFIGNSHTFVNDLPKTFGKLVLAGDSSRALVVKDVTVGGASLADHIQRGFARRAIEGERWDFVVLQEQSLLPTVAPEHFERSVRALDEVIRHAGAKTVLYELWPRRQGQEPAALDATYREVAGDVHAELASVGPAWARALAADPKLVLYQPDGYHPEPAGTYLAACVFYEALTGRSSLGLPTLGMVTDAEAAELQRASHISP